MAFQKKIDTQDMQVGQAADIILKDGTLATGGASIDVIDTNALNKNWMDDIAFMEEEMEIIVMETSDENAENPVTVGNQGIFKQFYRGQPTVAKRKFVDCLIVKTGRVTTPKIKNNAGEDAFAIRQQSAHKYPFSVLQDRNPKGAEWLRRRMAEII